MAYTFSAKRAQKRGCTFTGCGILLVGETFDDRIGETETDESLRTFDLSFEIRNVRRII